MYTFRRMSFWRRLLLRISPRRRAEYERQLRDDIRYLVEHPDVPVGFEY